MLLAFLSFFFFIDFIATVLAALLDTAIFTGIEMVYSLSAFIS